jgi:Leucine-rich repeat (LRR) protein
MRQKMTQDTPAKIYEEFINENTDKITSINKLITLIENSDNLIIREQSVRYLDKIAGKNLKNDVSIVDFFKIFENLIISDSNERIRRAALMSLVNCYKERSYVPLKWSLHHEESPTNLEEILSHLMNILDIIYERREDYSNSFLIKEIEQASDKEFKIGFQIMKEQRQFQFERFELIKLLKSSFILQYLKTAFWRIKIELNECKIVGLDFIFKGLTKIPEALKYLDDMKRLTLRYNQISELPDWIANLKSLKYLNLNINALNKIPDSIGNLSNLKELQLWKNELTQLPETLNNLNNLEILNIRLNNLIQLPKNFGKFNRLKSLDLHDNKIIELSDDFSNLISLKYLNLSWNCLKTLPEAIGELQSLEELDLERNELIRIPSSIGDLKQLKVLNLADNKLKILPESIGLIQSLESLNLSKNQLFSLPKSLLNLNNLKEIFFGNNDFKEIPKIMTDLEKKGIRVSF